MGQKSGQEPAFASVSDRYIQEGMSKRFYAACAAMQGILSGSPIGGLPDDTKIVKIAYDIADELLKQENKTEQ